MNWIEGQTFRHSRWWTEDASPARCEVVRISEDHYKGRPLRVVTVQEIGGRRMAAYQEDRVPVLQFDF